MPGADPAEGPFQPRLRPGAFLRSLRGGRPGPTAGSPFVLPALAATLFCFYQVFLAFDRMEGAGVSAPLVDARSPIFWFMLGAGCAGLTALAMQHRVERKASLKPGALREAAREAREGLRSWTRERREKKRAARAPASAAEGPLLQGR